MNDVALKDVAAKDLNGMVREYAPVVFGAAWRILGHATDAEDVVQDVFLEVHRSQKARSTEQWAKLLRRLATFRALDRLRMRRPAKSLDDSNLVGTESSPEAAAIGRELEDRLRRAIGELPEREAAVFCLRYFEDHSYDQIANLLGVSGGAVATALHKARAKLKTMLDDGESGDSHDK